MSSKEHKQISNQQRSFLESLRGDRRRLMLFVLLSAFCLFSKLPRLEIPSDFYFDEVYHAYTATLYLHGDKKAYNPWGKADVERGIEWTHPPLSKLIMTGAMQVFGENSFGWRIGSVVFGTAAAVAAAVLAFELFGSLSIALLTLFLMSVETLLFAQSRVAMNDSYFVFFMLFGLIFYTRWRRGSPKARNFYLAGLGLGLALATKWTALYLFMLIAVDLVGEVVWKGRIPKHASLPHLFLAFCCLPFLVYLASYGQFFIWGSGWDDFVKLQQEMWRYHTGLVGTHSYTSKPWQWLFNLKPVWMSVDYSSPGKVGHIYNIGNTVVMYAGLYAVFSALFREKNQSWTWQKWFVLLIYFGLWVPWIFSPRIMLFYHYLPAIPALCILLARWLDRLLGDRDPRRRNGAKVLLAASFAWMVLAYPFLTRIPLPSAIGDKFYSLFSG